MKPVLSFGSFFLLPFQEVNHTGGSKLTIKIRILALGVDLFDIQLMFFAAIAVYFT
jgi:hypothetical protein